VARSIFGRKSLTGAPAARGKAGEDGAPEARTPPRTELSALDFSGDVNRALAQCAGQVEVQEVGEGVGAFYEEAAVLYANGNTAEAEKVLATVLDDPARVAGEGLWMMLLDLYQLTGQRQRFEARVLDYATRFERSPPPWRDASGKPEHRKPDVAPLVNLAGSLSGQAAQQFQQIAIIGKKSGAIRIDLGRLRAVDATGCTLLRDVLGQLASERVKVSLLNCGQLATMLAGQVHPGQPEGRDMWLLLLEMLQHTGEHARFEDTAVDYAVTFEESPPSWEPKAQQEAATTTGALEQAVRMNDGFSLEGELTSATTENIRKLAAFASGRQAVEVDCSQLRRIDFVSAGTLFNILASLQAQGKLVTLKNVNAMVAALLRVMGVDQVAQVTLRG
jgi:anti-anti-sigma regulatory factor